jgi:hypothetical protein
MEAKLIQGKPGLTSDNTCSMFQGFAEFIPLRDKSSAHFSIKDPTSEVYPDDGSSDSCTSIEFIGLLPFLLHEVNLLDAGMYDGLE